jgi:hypothetical protein
LTMSQCQRRRRKTDRKKDRQRQSERERARVRLPILVQPARAAARAPPAAAAAPPPSSSAFLRAGIFRRGRTRCPATVKARAQPGAGRPCASIPPILLAPSAPTAGPRRLAPRCRRALDARFRIFSRFVPCAFFASRGQRARGRRRHSSAAVPACAVTCSSAQHCTLRPARRRPCAGPRPGRPGPVRRGDRACAIAELESGLAQRKLDRLRTHFAHRLGDGVGTAGMTALDGSQTGRKLHLTMLAIRRFPHLEFERLRAVIFSGLPPVRA